MQPDYFKLIVREINKDLYPFYHTDKSYQQSISNQKFSFSIVKRLLFFPLRVFFVSSYISQPLLFYGVFILFLSINRFTELLIMPLTLFAGWLIAKFLVRTNAPFVIRMKVIIDYAFAIIVGLNIYNPLLFEGIKNVFLVNVLLFAIVMPILFSFAGCRLLSLLLIKVFPNRGLYLFLKLINFLSAGIGIIPMLFVIKNFELLVNSPLYIFIQIYFLFGNSL